MKLVIEIEFGNDAMQRYSQARAVIHDGVGTSTHRAKPEIGESGTLRDVNGNRVGKWEVSEDQSAKIDPALLEQARLEIAMLVRFITNAPDRYTRKNPYGRPAVRRALHYLSGKPANTINLNYDAAEQVIAAAGVQLPYQDYQDGETKYAVVDANGEFKRKGRFDTGEFESEWEAQAFRASLPNPEDYTVSPIVSR